MGAMLAGPMLVAAQTAEDPSDVVLVFDVSNSILLSEDGTNTEFADALEGIADRVEANAEDLAIGNAEISFVVFGRTAITYRDRCLRLALHEDPAAIAALERCLRDIAAEYRAGPNAQVRDRINTQNTDHVAALRAAANLLPNETTRSAVIFFTDGQHDPPGTARDDENVVNEVEAAFEGQTPLAILPVGLGSTAGAFETELRAIYSTYFRDMEPCEGRASFAWPTVVFPEADNAGIAVAQALQEVTCSFNFAPPPTAAPTPVPTPTAPPPPGVPLNVQVLAGNESLTVQWVAPSEGVAGITGYLARCTPEGDGDPIEVRVEGPEQVEAELPGLEAGARFHCAVAGVTGAVTGRVQPGIGDGRRAGDPVGARAAPDRAGRCRGPRVRGPRRRRCARGEVHLRVPRHRGRDRRLGAGRPAFRRGAGAREWPDVRLHRLRGEPDRAEPGVGRVRELLTVWRAVRVPAVDEVRRSSGACSPRRSRSGSTRSTATGGGTASGSPRRSTAARTRRSVGAPRSGSGSSVTKGRLVRRAAPTRWGGHHGAVPGLGAVRRPVEGRDP